MEISGTFPSKLEKFKHRSALPNIMIFSFSDLLKNDRTDIISCKMFGHQYISNGFSFHFASFSGGEYPVFVFKAEGEMRMFARTGDLELSVLCQKTPRPQYSHLDF